MPGKCLASGEARCGGAWFPSPEGDRDLRPRERPRVMHPGAGLQDVMAQVLEMVRSLDAIELRRSYNQEWAAVLSHGEMVRLGP